MLCAHEPTMDPRIRWEADGATAQFRIPRAEVSVLNYFRRFAEAMDGPARWLVILLAVVFVLPLALLELCFRAVRMAYRTMKRLLFRGTGLLVTYFPTALRLVRGGHARARSALTGVLERSRVAYVMAVLRAQFAPATVFFWNFIIDMRDKPDVVHCNDLDTLLVGILAKKRFGTRVVYDAHEYYPHSDPHGGWIDRTLFHLLEKTLTRKADSVITVNHQLADVIRKAYGLPRVDSVPNAEPWTDGVIAEGSSSMRALAHGRVSFLFQGRFSPGRGIEEVLQAWAHVDPSVAVLFLRGPDNVWRRDLVRMAEQFGLLGRNVYFLDSVGEDDLIAAASEADVGLIPYKGEVAGYKYACPNKLSQYLHAGLMIVTNDLPYVREVIEEAEAGLHYSSYSPMTLVEVTHRIARNPDLLKRARANARRYAREKFNWQVFSPTLYEAYRRDQVVSR
jgi:glycosyltransferase involved in cell wall biosynthesis